MLLLCHLLYFPDCSSLYFYVHLVVLGDLPCSFYYFLFCVCELMNHTVLLQIKGVFQ